MPYDAWVREGFITATEGNVIDQAFIRTKINELATIYNIRELAYDRWGAQKISTELQGDGLTIVPFGQGYASMAAPSKQIRGTSSWPKACPWEQPRLDMDASNVAVKQDPAGNVKPDKAQSADRIDGIVALVMGLGRAVVQQEEAIPTIWGIY